MTEPVESSGRRGGDQIKEMELKLHPDLKGPLRALCEDERTTVIVLSGSDRSVLDEVILRADLSVILDLINCPFYFPLELTYLSMCTEFWRI